MIPDSLTALGSKVMAGREEEEIQVELGQRPFPEMDCCVLCGCRPGTRACVHLGVFVRADVHVCLHLCKCVCAW